MTRRFGGTGSGYDQPIGAHDGWRSGSRELGVGSTFWITARLSKAAMHSPLPQRADVATALPEIIIAQRFGGARVLLVEDDFDQPRGGAEVVGDGRAGRRYGRKWVSWRLLVCAIDYGGNGLDGYANAGDGGPEATRIIPPPCRARRSLK